MYSWFSGIFCTRQLYLSSCLYIHIIWSWNKVYIIYTIGLNNTAHNNSKYTCNVQKKKHNTKCVV